MHRQTAKAHLERRGVVIRSELPAMTPDQVRAAGQLYETPGVPLAQVATWVEAAPNTLRRALGWAGFQIRLSWLPGPGLT